MSLEAYWEKLNNLPKELSDIIQDNYDYTGRPNTLQSHSNVIIGILNKNAKGGGQAFLNDMALVFPEMSREEVAVYYNVFIAGANFIANNLKNT